MRFDILTLFPEMFESYLGQGHLKLAIERGLVDIRRHNFREFAPGVRRQVDDKPFGGGPGMLLMCQPVFDCVEAVQSQGNAPGRLVMMTPQGRKMDQRLVEELAQEPRLLYSVADTKVLTTGYARGCSQLRSRSATSSAMVERSQPC